MSNPYTVIYFFFFLNDPAPPEFSPLPLPAAFPSPCISGGARLLGARGRSARQQQRASRRGAQPAAELASGATAHATRRLSRWSAVAAARFHRSEEHTSELQSQSNLVCRLLLEKQKG